MKSILLACAVLAVSLVGCEKKTQGAGRVVTWVLNPAETLKRTDPAEQASVRKALEGLQIVLELRGDNTFGLTITGGKEPQVSSGMYKVGFENIFLTRKVIDGKPSPAGDDWKLGAGGSYVEVPANGVTTYLTKR